MLMGSTLFVGWPPGLLPESADVVAASEPSKVFGVLEDRLDASATIEFLRLGGIGESSRCKEC